MESSGAPKSPGLPPSHAPDANTEIQSENIVDAIDSALAEVSAQNQAKESSDASSSSSDTDSGTDSDSDSESDSDSNSNSDGDDDEETIVPEDTEVPRTKNEVTELEIPKLPADFEITADTRIQIAGTIFNVTKNSLIIQASSSGEDKILDEGAIFCLADRTIVGPLYETFGPVERPFFVVRFETGTDMSIYSRETDVYFVESVSKLVPTQGLRIKGSDASNLHDEEVAPEEQDYSNDEDEALAKAPNKRRKRTKKASTRPSPPIRDNASVQKPPHVSHPQQQSMKLQNQMAQWYQYQQFLAYQQSMAGYNPQLQQFGQMNPVQQPQPPNMPIPQFHPGMVNPPGAFMQAPENGHSFGNIESNLNSREQDDHEVEHQWPKAPPNY